jgi:hypothetical protein
MAYAMASDVYGKADDKGYNPEKDAASLIAQIVNGDPYGDGLRWITPFWAKSHATTAPAPLPALEAPRPAHRPAGDRTKHLVTFRRVLESIQPDDFGRRTYTLDYLADKMKIARCAVAPRTIQSYLKTLRDNEEIVTAQIGGNGLPYAVLTRCFGGADNSQKRVETPPESPAIGGADQSAEQGILTPEIAESSLQCKEDHQNSSAPAAVAEPGGASYDPARVWNPVLWVDPTAIRVPEEWIDRTPPPRQARRQARQKGQESFLGRGGAIAAKITRRKHHGEMPAPTPYRPHAALPLETLPEPPAPAGAQSAGAPLSGPQAGPTPAQRIAERRRREQVQP